EGLSLPCASTMPVIGIQFTTFETVGSIQSAIACSIECMQTRTFPRRTVFYFFPHYYVLVAQCSSSFTYLLIKAAKPRPPSTKIPSDKPFHGLGLPVLLVTSLNSVQSLISSFPRWNVAF